MRVFPGQGASGLGITAALPDTQMRREPLSEEVEVAVAVAVEAKETRRSRFPKQSPAPLAATHRLYRPPKAPLRACSVRQPSRILSIQTQATPTRSPQSPTPHLQALSYRQRPRPARPAQPQPAFNPAEHPPLRSPRAYRSSTGHPPHSAAAATTCA